MHHLVVGIIFYALMALVVVVFGPAAVAPLADQIPRARRGTLIACWLALLLLVPPVLALLNSYLDDHQHTYLHELGQVWPVSALFVSALIVSCVRRWRRRVR